MVLSTNHNIAYLCLTGETNIYQPPPTARSEPMFNNSTSDSAMDDSVDIDQEHSDHVMVKYINI